MLLLTPFPLPLPLPQNVNIYSKLSQWQHLTTDIADWFNSEFLAQAGLPSPLAEVNIL